MVAFSKDTGTSKQQRDIESEEESKRNAGGGVVRETAEINIYESKSLPLE